MTDLSLSIAEGNRLNAQRRYESNPSDWNERILRAAELTLRGIKEQSARQWMKQRDAITP